MYKYIEVITVNSPSLRSVCSILSSLLTTSASPLGKDVCGFTCLYLKRMVYIETTRTTPTSPAKRTWLFILFSIHRAWIATPPRHLQLDKALLIFKITFVFHMFEYSILTNTLNKCLFVNAIEQTNHLFLLKETTSI